jgi:hypothetical protein
MYFHARTVPPFEVTCDRLSQVEFLPLAIDDYYRTPSRCGFKQYTLESLAFFDDFLLVANLQQGLVGKQGNYPDPGIRSNSGARAEAQDQ